MRLASGADSYGACDKGHQGAGIKDGPVFLSMTDDCLPTLSFSVQPPPPHCRNLVLGSTMWLLEREAGRLCSCCMVSQSSGKGVHVTARSTAYQATCP